MTAKREPRIDTFQGKDKRWYWRCIAANGRVILDGAESYTRERDVLRAVERSVNILCRAYLRDHGLPKT